jgi:hypothetical protein
MSDRPQAYRIQERLRIQISRFQERFSKEVAKIALWFRCF